MITTERTALVYQVHKDGQPFANPVLYINPNAGLVFSKRFFSQRLNRIVKDEEIFATTVDIDRLDLEGNDADLVYLALIETGELPLTKIISQVPQFIHALNDFISDQTQSDS